MSRVYIKKVSREKSLASQTKKLLEHIDLETLFSGKEKILIKPNFSGEGGSTDPQVVKGVVDALEPLKLDVVVGESTICGDDTEAVFDQLKVRDILDTEVVDFKKNPFVKVDVPGKVIDHVLMADRALDAAVVSVAKLKTLNATTVSLCLKNLKGLLPDTEKLRFHHVGVSQAVVDLYSVVKPDLSVIDAVEGYDMGNPVQVDRLIAGCDAVSVDIVGSRMMGIDPFSINVGYPSYSHIAKAVAQGLGDGNPEVEGDFCCVPFKGPPTSLKEITLPAFINVIDGSPCSACTGILNLALKRLSTPLMSPVTICIGPRSPKLDGALCVGNCVKKGSGAHVVGCPPNSRLDLKPALEQFIKEGKPC